MRANAPRRTQGYYSANRSGVTSSGAFTNRVEERLAVGLRRRGELALPNGERLRLLDYQTPLKSVHADNGIGKIDLLGLDAEGTLAVVDLKVEGNAEDRRIALLEGLIYAAIIEANIAQVAKEFGDAHGQPIVPARPRLLVIASSAYWSDVRAYPSNSDLAELTGEIARAIPIDIALLRLCDADGLDFGLSGQPPRVYGQPFLSSVDDDAEARVPSRSTPAAKHRVYLAALHQTFWAYHRRVFAGDGDLFEPRQFKDQGPVVFRAGYRNRNLLVPPAAPPETIAAIEAMIAPAKRHRHFGSMQSSQALAQSVFAGLAALNRLDALATLAAEDGYPAFFHDAAAYAMELEHQVSALGEPRPTSVDVFFSGPTKVAVEVKFAEDGFGRCSRPGLTSDKPNHARDHCDGSFTFQRGRTTRCSLSERGVGYWQYAPRIFAWSADHDHRPCPLRSSYQLVRNVLATCVGENGTVDTENRHALVLYDGRNPAFHLGGQADVQWRTVVRALRHPRLLRKLSWQSLAAHLEQFHDLAWLVAGLRDKYGIR